MNADPRFNPPPFDEQVLAKLTAMEMDLVAIRDQCKPPGVLRIAMGVLLGNILHWTFAMALNVALFFLFASMITAAAARLARQMNDDVSSRSQLPPLGLPARPARAPEPHGEP